MPVGMLLAWARLSVRLSATAASSEELPINGSALRNTAPILAHARILVRTLSQTGAPRGLCPSPRGPDGGRRLPDGRLGLQSQGPLAPAHRARRRPHPGSTDGRRSPARRGALRPQPDAHHGHALPPLRGLCGGAGASAALGAERTSLDLGGDTAGTAALAKGGLVTLFDREICCEIAKERYSDDIETRAGDFMVDDLGGPYHLIVMSNIVHGLGPEMDTLYPRQAALVPAVLAIKDMFLDHTMARPESAALFGLTMLMYTSDGRSHTLIEMRHTLERAGFTDFDMVDLRDQRFSVILAR